MLLRLLARRPIAMPRKLLKPPRRLLKKLPRKLPRYVLFS